MTTTLTNTDSQDQRAINSLLISRPRQSGRHFPLVADSHSLAIEIPGQPYVDRQSMSARAVISTPTIDRVGDILVPRGCQTSNYVNNPVVLWAHGLEGINYPIATSRNPNGKLAVFVSDDDVQATCWFSQKSLEAAQIFELIDEGIVRATSVRETPIKSHVHRDLNLGDVLVVDEWDLEEWSWCAVGVNPDAVAKTLRRNRLGGQPITQSVMKALIAVAPTLKRFGIGLPKEKIVKEQSLLNDTQLDPNAGDDLMSPADCDDPDSLSQPYGATVVAAVHSSLSSIGQNISDALGPLENPAVKEGLMAILSVLQEQTTALEGLYASNYPDQPALKADVDNDGGDGGDDDAAMKAFLASGKIASLRVLGLGARLKGLIGAPNLTRVQRRTLGDVIRQIAHLVSEAKSRQSSSDEIKIVNLKRSIQELTDLVGSLKRS